MKLITMQRNLTPLTFSEFSFWSCTAVPFLYKICWRSRTYFIAPFLYHGTAEASATDCPYSLHRVDFQPLAISYRTPLVSHPENAPTSRITWGKLLFVILSLTGLVFLQVLFPSQPDSPQTVLNTPRPTPLTSALSFSFVLLEEQDFPKMNRLYAPAV